MKQTKGAIGNLLNRYRAVLKKCHLLNTFGSLAVASMLVMGGAEISHASNAIVLNPGQEYVVEDDYNYVGDFQNPVVVQADGNSISKLTFTGSNISISNIFGLNPNSKPGDRLGVWAIGTYQNDNSPEIVLGDLERTKNITINLENEGGTIGVWANRPYSNESQGGAGGKITINTQELNINTSSKNSYSYGIYAQNCTTTATGNIASIDINANNIYIDSSSSYGGAPIVAMSQGQIDITGNLYVNTRGGTTPDAIVARGKAKVYINQDGTGNEIVQLNGNINFNYDGPTSGTKVDADVKITLAGEESFWNGNTSVSWNIEQDKGNVPATDLLEVQNMELTLKDGAKWTPTLVERDEYQVTNETNGKVYNQGEDYLALNVLNLDQGIIDVNEGIKIVVEKLGDSEEFSGSGELNNNGTTVFESGNLGDLRAVNNGSLTLQKEMNTTITSLSGSGSVDNAGTLQLDGEAENNSISNTGTLSVTSNTTTVNALTNSGTVNVGGKGSAARLAITGSWAEEENAETSVGNLGTLSVAQHILLDENMEVKAGVQKVSVASGGTYEITGLDKMTVDQAKALNSALLESSSGTIYLRDTTLTDLTPTGTGEHAGHYQYSAIKDLGVTVDQLLESTVDVDDTATTAVSGGFKNVDLLDGDTLIAKGDDLTLAGSTYGGNLINTSNEDGEPGNLRIGKTSGSDTSGENTTVTLGLLDEAHSGDVGDIIMNAGATNTANLHVYGKDKDQAHFTADRIITSGTDNAYESITVQGAKFTVDSIAVSNNGDPLDEMDIINGIVEVEGGNANLKDVTLNDGSLQALSPEDPEVDGGNITISGDLSGQGTVKADNTLSLTNAEGLTTAEGDDLKLESKVVSTGKIDSTAGVITIVASDELTTDGEVTLNDEDVVLAQYWILGSDDKVTASGNSYQLVGQFATSTPGDIPSTLDTTYTVNEQAQLVHMGVDLQDEDQLEELRTALGKLRGELDRHGFKDSPAYLTDQTLNLTETGKLVVGDAEEATISDNRVVFGKGSVLMVDADIDGAVFTADVTGGQSTATAYVADGSNLYIDNATAESKITIFGDGFGNVTVDGWDAIQTDTAMLKATYEDKQVKLEVQDARTEFPGLSDELAIAVNDLYKGSLNNEDHESLGIRFLSRATNDEYIGIKDRTAAAATIESAARIALAGAVPQMTKMASDSATNSVVNRMGFANPENGAKAMNVDGKLVDDKALGLALWIAPLWSNQNGFGMEAGNLDYGYNANIGGISLGADYTWANNFRAGLMFNIGGGYAESSGDLSETTNSMTFWGVGAYGGWKYENFAVMGDVSYTSTWNSVDQDLDHRMQMGDLESDIQASAISAGLRFEYKLETQYLDLIPHVGARYMSINTWGYDVETNGGTVLEGDGFQQNIWTFPVGITFSKELEMNNDWYFKPSVDFTVIPAAGDIKAKEDVLFTGMQRSYEVETQMMDYFTWQGGVGLEFGNDNMSVGVNYTLQAGQNSTGHGVFGMFRYEF